MTISQPTRGLRRSLASRLNGPSLPSYVSNGITYPTTDIDSFRLDIDVEPGERIAFILESIASDDVEGAALLEIQALTSNGTRIAIPQWGYRSNRIQEFQYLSPAGPENIAQTVFSVPIPENVASLQLVGRKWKRNVKTSIVGSPVINRENQKGWIFETDTGAKLEFPAHRFQSTFEVEPNSERVQITVNHVARGTGSSGPLVVKFLDKDGIELMPSGQLAQHSKFGPIVLLNGDVGIYQTTLVELSVPESAQYISIEGLDWSKKTADIVGNIAVDALSERELTVEEFVAAIPSDDKLYVVDTTAPPMGHKTLALRPNNLSLTAIKKSHWVIFLPFSSLQEFPPHPAEKLYQVPRADVDKLWAALRKYRTTTNDTYICSSFPSFESLTTAYDLRRLGWKVVYEVRDDMEEFNRVGYSKWYRPVLEQKMLAIADKVVSVSRALDEKMAAMQPELGPHTVIPNGVRQSVIDEGVALRSIEAVQKREGSRIVGYVGHLTESWFDWPLLISAAQSLPDIRFEIVGHGMPHNLTLPPNVVILGPKTHEEMRLIVEDWKVGLIPFKDIPLTHSVDPNKIYEYFAWGLRCVTVQMGSVDSYPWTRVYQDLDSFMKHIRWGVEAPVTAADLKELERFVEGMSWDSRMDDMISFIDTGAEK